MWQNTGFKVTVAKMDWTILGFTILFIFHISFLTMGIYIVILAIYAYAAKKGWAFGDMIGRLKYVSGPEHLMSMDKTGTYWSRYRVIMSRREPPIKKIKKTKEPKVVK
jgi:hypothetical protein